MVSMKKILAVSLAAMAISGLSTTNAKAGVSFGLSIGVSAPPVYVAPAPVYVAPAPVPAPVYVREPVYVAPPPVVYAPPAVVVRPAFGFFGYSHFGHGWGHHYRRHCW